MAYLPFSGPVPIAVIVVILADLAEKLISLTEPITENMALGGPVFKAIVAIILLVLAVGLFLFINGLIGEGSHHRVPPGHRAEAHCFQLHCQVCR